MCEITGKCPNRATFWVQTRRELPATGQTPASGRNTLACGKHLARAVKAISTLNTEAGNGMHRPTTDGVIVKVKSGNAWR